MAKILADQNMITLMPDFVSQVRNLVGDIKITESLVPGTKEIYFESPLYTENEIVLARVTDTNLNKEFRITSINSTKKFFIHYT